MITAGDRCADDDGKCLPALLDGAFARRAHIWAQFGLLTGEQHRKQYHDLADLMRQGTPTEEAVATAFGISLKELTEQFEGGAWRKDASYRLPAPASPPPSVATPVELDAAVAEELLKVLKERVVEFAGR